MTIRSLFYDISNFVFNSYKSPPDERHYIQTALLNLTVKADPSPERGTNHQPRPVPREDVFDDGKPETGAFFGPAGLDINPIESLGKAGHMFLCYAGSKIPAR
jgi:hypothetical protein